MKIYRKVTREYFVCDICEKEVEYNGPEYYDQYEKIKHFCKEHEIYPEIESLLERIGRNDLIKEIYKKN